MSAPRLSALVVVHNEEAQFAACLDTLSFADEIVVVLDRCTDGSKEIAARYTDRLIEGAFEIEGDRRNKGIETCTGDWILEVDADERVPASLAREIRAAIQGAAPGYFLIPFDNYVGDRLVKYGWGAAWGVSAAVRLFTPGAKIWGRERVHPKLRLSGERRRLSTPMVHYVDRSVTDMIDRLNRYTSARAKDLRESGDIGRLGPNVRRIFSRFWKCYVARRGYREGPHGFLIALMAGLYPILSHLKARIDPE